MAQSRTIERREVYYSGRVQGVGFRYTTQRLAQRFPVTGFVRNLSDGRVQVVAEGERSELEAFLDAIADRMGNYIQHIQLDRFAPSGEFDGFDVRF